MTLEERAEKALLDTLESATYDGPCAFFWVHILDAIRAAVAEEREACAKVAEESDAFGYFVVKDLGSQEAFRITKKKIAAAIRARGTHAQV